MSKCLTTDDVGAVLHSIQNDEFNVGRSPEVRERASLLRLQQAAFMLESSLLLQEVLPTIRVSEPDSTVDADSMGSGFISSTISIWPTEEDEEPPALLAAFDPQADWEPRSPSQKPDIAPDQEPRKPSPSPSM